jgi:excisionase family DNA binding protein
MDDVAEEYQYAAWQDLPSTLTVAEVAVILRLDPDTVYKSIAARGIPAKRLGRQYRIQRDQLIRWWASD